MTPVAALAVPPGGASVNAGHEWTLEQIRVLMMVEDLNYDAIDILRTARANVYKRDNGTPASRYWRNHCSHCGLGIEDSLLHQTTKAKAAFDVLASQDRSQVRVTAFVSPIEAVAASSMTGALLGADTQDQKEKGSGA